MKTRGYTLLGWVVWHVSKRFARYELSQNKAKLGAGATVLGVLAAGVIAAKLAARDADD